MKTCGQCLAHYVAIGMGKNGKGEEVPVGHCYRLPPVINVAGGSVHPVVGEAERRCGEFSSRRPTA